MPLLNANLRKDVMRFHSHSCLFKCHYLHSASGASSNLKGNHGQACQHLPIPKSLSHTFSHTSWALLEFCAHDGVSGTLRNEMAKNGRQISAHRCALLSCWSPFGFCLQNSVQRSKWQPKCIKLSMGPFWARDTGHPHSLYTHEASPPQMSSLLGWDRARRSL